MKCTLLPSESARLLLPMRDIWQKLPATAAVDVLSCLCVKELLGSQAAVSTL